MSTNKSYGVLIAGALIALLCAGGGILLGAKYAGPGGSSFGATDVSFVTQPDFSEGLRAGYSRQFTISRTGAITSSGAITSTGNFTTTGTITGREPAIAGAGTTTLTTAQTNGVIYIGTGGLYTLPATASSAGVTYRFVIASAITADAVISSAGAASGDDIEGSLIVAGAVVDCAAVDVITFVSDGEDLGDYVELRSNGTKWYIGASNGLTASKLTCSG